MARKAETNQPNGIVVTAADTPNLPAMADAVNVLAAHSNAVAKQFGDGHQYDRTRLVNETRFYMAQSAEAMLEAGKRLIVLKENEPHGEFMEIVQQLGLVHRTAQLIMQAALKYLSPSLASKAQTFAHLSKCKLFELMTESDDELVSLADGGTVAGLKLDDIDRMTVRELRHALRESKENAEAQARLLSDKNERIDQLDGKISKLQKHLKSMPPPDVAAEMRSEAAQAASVAEVSIRRLRAGFASLLEHGEQHGIPHGDLMAGLLCQLELAIRELRSEFDIKAVPDGEAMPDWMREDTPLAAGA